MIRRLPAAIGVDVWAIESGGLIFDVRDTLDASYHVDGLTVRFSGRVRRSVRSVLAEARILDLTALAIR